MTFGIGDDVALTALDLLARVKPAWTAAFRSLRRLAVDDAGGRARRAPGALARCHHQHVVDGHKRSAARPLIKITLDGRPRREIPRQLPPLTTGRGHVQHRVHNRAQIALSWPTDQSTRRHQRLNQLPLRFRQVACVTQSVPHIVRSSDFGPGHRDLPRIFANPMESQPPEITHLFFGQALRPQLIWHLKYQARRTMFLGSAKRPLRHSQKRWSWYRVSIFPTQT